METEGLRFILVKGYVGLDNDLWYVKSASKYVTFTLVFYH